MRRFPLARPADADDAVFQDVYGPWAQVRPTDVTELLGSFAKPWWVAGGWAVDALTGTDRTHTDIDVGIYRAHVPDLLAATERHLHIWSVGPIGLRPLDVRDPSAADQGDQLWVRADARAPWLLDILLTPDDAGRWVSRRDGHTAALNAVTHDRAGVRYLDLAEVLIFKAKAARDKDLDDLRRSWPAMGAISRRRLRTFLTENKPDHPWLDVIGAGIDTR